MSVSFERNMAVLGSSLLISHPGTCSWVSSDAILAFNDTFLYDWPIWKFRYVIHYMLYTNDAATNYIFFLVAMTVLIQAMQMCLAVNIL